MSNPLPSPRLLVITDRRHAALPLIDAVAAAVDAGCRWIMVREKDLDRPALIALARDILAVAAPAGARVLINGDIGAAMAAGVDGVHVQTGEAAARAREALGDGALIGVSAHSLADANLAVAGGTNYITLSPVFTTPSKPGYGPQLGLAGLRSVCAAVPVPVVALAGITAENAAGCIEAGAAAVATMGGVMSRRDPSVAVRVLIAALNV